MNDIKAWGLNTLIFYFFIALLFSLVHFLFLRSSKLSSTSVRFFRFTASTLPIVFFIILVAAFRSIGHNVGGTDAYYYANYHLDEDAIPFSLDGILTLTQKESLFYNILYYLGNIFDTHIISFLLIYSVLVWAYIAFFRVNFKKSTDWIFSSLIILQFLKSFNIIRNALAIAVSLFAINALKRDKRILFLAISLIAVMIHYSAIIMIFFGIFYWILRRTNIFSGSRKSLSTFIILSSISLFGATELMRHFLSSTIYSGYIDNEYSLWGYAPILILLLTCIVFLKPLLQLLRREENEIHLYALVFNVITLPVMISLGGASRMILYFEFSRILLWSCIFYMIYKGFLRQKISLAHFYLFATCLLVFLWIIYKITSIWESYGLMPYHTDIFRIIIGA